LARVLPENQTVEREIPTANPHRVAAILTVAAMAGLASAFDVSLSAEDAASADALIQMVVAQTTRAAVSTRALRELRAGTTSGKHHGWMEVETVMNPSSGLTWRVLEEGGSERTRNKVLRQVLQAEAASQRNGSDATALTPENYSFQPLAPQCADQLNIRLIPRRDDDKLIDGVLTVSPDGYPLQLEGKLAKSPSFWVRTVTIVRRYGRIAGVALPISLESTAEVRLVGQSSFTMRYDYREVNGERILHSTATDPAFRSSADMLAAPRH
jgi:hypothetical protein